MKKLITLTLIFVLTSIIVSCKSSSVLKRRYNKGYYVHHAAKHSEPKAQDNKTASHKTAVFVAPPAEQIAVVSKAKPENNAPKITAGAEEKKAPVKSIPAAKPQFAKAPLKLIPTAFSMQQSFKVIKDLKAKAASGDAAGDALSLLWIIILILLIFYLLGFAFDMYGVGPIFNLLALIIVILLILWLLRIL